MAGTTSWTRKPTASTRARATSSSARVPTTPNWPRCPLRIFLVQLPFACCFVWLEGPKALVWLAALTLSTAVYNWPPPGFKGRPPFDVLNQVGYLLVFVLSSWLNRVPQLPWQTYLFGALFAMHAHLFGEIMDVEPDRLAGRRTTATTIGAVPAKALIAALLAAEGVLVCWVSATR